MIIPGDGQDEAGARQGQHEQAARSRQTGVVGSALAALVGFGSTRQMLLLLAADGVVLVVGLIACAVPLRRALAIDPTEALRAEG